MSKKFLRIAAVIGALVLVCGSSVFSQKGGRHDDSVDRFLANLEQEGFAVKEGVPELLDPAELYCEGVIPTALFYNEGAPYVTVRMPQLDGAAPIPFPWAIRLRPDEAIVVIGLTPPEAQYFSYQPYLLSRIPPGKTIPVPMFNSLGDTVNLRTINTIGNGVFNQPVALVFTPDQGTEYRVRAALRSAGYPAAIINTLVIPSSMLNLGIGASSDLLLILHRMALFTDPIAGKAFTDNPPLRAFRVTPRAAASGNPFPVPPLRIRGTGQTEMDLYHDLNRLRQAILDANSGFTATEYGTRPMAYDGYDYTQQSKNTFGDTRDTLYLGAGYVPDFGSTDEITLRPNDFLIAYGLNHMVTGKATYTNVNVYDGEKSRLSLGSIYTKDLQRSADAYLPGDPAADLMYVCKIGRAHSDEDFYLQIAPPEGCSPLELTSLTRLGVSWRLYLEPRTNIGPAYTEILYDRVIKFSRGS